MVGDRTRPFYPPPNLPATLRWLLFPLPSFRRHLARAWFTATFSLPHPAIPIHDMDTRAYNTGLVIISPQTCSSRMDFSGEHCRVPRRARMARIHLISRGTPAPYVWFENTPRALPAPASLAASAGPGLGVACHTIRWFDTARNSFGDTATTVA